MNITILYRLLKLSNKTIIARRNFHKMADNFEEVIKFWFEETTPKQHYAKDDEFDNLIKKRFGALHTKATTGELKGWRNSPSGCLAEIIILDQFSRNIYRDMPESFAHDYLAVNLAEDAITKGFDEKLETNQRGFLYLPFMHSESKDIHEKAVKLFSTKGLEMNLEFELKHKVIIDRFGRYPHRNKILGRESTPEEIDFLQQPNSSF